MANELVSGALCLSSPPTTNQPLHAQVVRHERASIKADIWSYGILIWELITGEDITEYQPLSISRQVRLWVRVCVCVREGGWGQERDQLHSVLVQQLCCDAGAT